MSHNRVHNISAAKLQQKIQIRKKSADYLENNREFSLSVSRRISRRKHGEVIVILQ